MGHGLINIVGRLIIVAVGFFLIPIMLARLGSRMYGLWLITETIATGVSSVTDFGIRLTVMREVGACKGEIDDWTARFVSAAANLNLRLAFLGGLFIAILGTPIASLLAVTRSDSTVLARVFIFVAIGFVADQLTFFQLSVLQGLRRFDLFNLYAISTALINAVAVVATLVLKGGLSAVIQVQMSMSIVGAIAVYFVTRHVAPRLPQGIQRQDWTTLRSRARFSLLTNLTILANVGLWQGPPLLIGLVLGPISLVPYYIGCKFPLTFNMLTWDLAVVMIPAVSHRERGGSVAHAAETLEIGTRWVVVATVPFYVILWIVGPHLLDAWLGRVPPGSVPILRFMTIATAAGALDSCAFSVMVGRGEVRTVLAVVCGELAIVAGLLACLLGSMGALSAAFALAVFTPVAALVILRVAAAECGSTLPKIARQVSHGLWMPILASACATSLAMHLSSSMRWLGVILAVSAGLIVYVGVFLFASLRENERVLIRDWIQRVRQGKGEQLSSRE
jgi:O-antigen/teichoic acid export membrane protein